MSLKHEVGHALWLARMPSLAVTGGEMELAGGMACSFNATPEGGTGRVDLGHPGWDNANNRIRKGEAMGGIRKLGGLWVPSLVILMLGTGAVSHAQTNTFPSSGAVGIGTLTPSYPLHISTSGSFAGVMLDNAGGGGSAWGIQSDSGIPGQGASLSIYSFSASDYRLVVNGGGNIGIGTVNPASLLHIRGSGVLGGVGLRLDNSTPEGQAYELISEDGTGKLHIVDRTRAALRMTLDPVGNIGIGTTIPSAKLHVAGTATVDGSIGIGTASPASLLHIRGSGVLGGVGFRLDNPTPGGRAYELISEDGTGKLYIVDRTGAALRMTLDSAGNVGIGTTSPTSTLHVVGTVSGTNIMAQYQDVAEWVPAQRSLAPGTVVVIDPRENNRVLPATQAYDTRIAGVVSGQPGILLGEAGEDKAKVAHSGRVKVKVDAGYGPIVVGDLLVSSATAGYAMRSTPIEMNGVPIHRPGTIVGKALEPLKEGQGEILVLVTLQ